MSYNIDLIVVQLPEDDKQAWKEIDKLRDVYAAGDNRPIAPALELLHSRLTLRYPCLCSYADGDERIDQCPWADGPMINNFSHEMGMLAISFSRVADVVPFVITNANELGIALADGQTGKIFRPAANRNKEKSWYKLW